MRKSPKAGHKGLAAVEVLVMALIGVAAGLFRAIRRKHAISDCSRKETAMKPKAASGRSGLVVISILVVSIIGASAALMGLSNPESSPALRDDSTLSRARRLLDQGKIAEAKRVFSEELKRDSKGVEALRGLAMCARDEGDDETAIQYLQKLTALAPQDRAAWRQLALAASRLGRDMEALSAAQTALALSPEGDRALTDLMTRLLTAKDAFKDGMFEDPFAGVGPTNRLRRKPAPDASDLMPRPRVPEPAQDLPKAGRRE